VKQACRRQLVLVGIPVKRTAQAIDREAATAIVKIQAIELQCRQVHRVFCNPDRAGHSTVSFEVSEKSTGKRNLYQALLVAIHQLWLQ